MFGWLKEKATKLQISNTKRDLNLLIDICENSKKSDRDIQMMEPLLQNLISSMRGPLPKRDLVSEIFSPVLKSKKYKKETKEAVQICVDNYQDSHPK